MARILAPMDNIRGLRIPRFDTALRNARNRGDGKRMAQIFEGMPFQKSVAGQNQLSLGTVAFVDVETTGLEVVNGHQVIELFALKTDYSLNPVDYFYSLLRPEARISYNAYRAHSFNNGDLAAAPLPEKIFPQFDDFLRGVKTVAGYNVKYDLGFLFPKLENLGNPTLLDVLDIVKTLYPKSPELKSHRLGSVIDHLRIEGINSRNLHSPVEDIKATFLLYSHMCKTRPEALARYQAERGVELFVPENETEPQQEFEFQYPGGDEYLRELGLESDGEYLKHPNLQAGIFKIKDYQLQYAARALQKNIALALDTSLGKLNISLLSALRVLSKDPASQVIYLTPRLEIIANHLRECEKFLNGIKVGELTSHVSDARQLENANEAQIIFGTPETVNKLIQAGSLKTERISLLVVDEAHIVNQREEGKNIVRAINSMGRARTTILSATPGKDMEETMGLLADFGIDPKDMYVLRRESERVSYPYVREVDKIKVASPNTRAIEEWLQGLIIRSMTMIIRSGKYLPEDQALADALKKIERIKENERDKIPAILHAYFEGRAVNPMGINERVEDILARAEEAKDYMRAVKWGIFAPTAINYYRNGYRDFLENLKREGKIEKGPFFYLIKEAAKVGTLSHLLQYLVLGQPHAFKSAFNRLLQDKKAKSKQELKVDFSMRQIRDYLFDESKKIEGFPPRGDFYRDYRLEEMKRFVEKYKLPGEKILILVRLRERAKFLADELGGAMLWGGKKIEGMRGFTPKQKEKILKEFNQGAVEVLVATEEVLGNGVTLDMDFLILDTPPLSPKQFIQQLGRVARTKDGFAYCLIGEHPNEKRMEFVRDLNARRMKKHLDRFLD